VKEHCLMGYKGDSKKAFDSNFIHPNIDIDVVITEEPEVGSLSKPSEVYDIIERFCLGRKRIEIFGTKDNIRNGWLTIGNQIPETKFILS
jgi:mRNA m6A methyltransferase non-catalytic subunit